MKSIYKSIYTIFCKCYSEITTFLENLFLRVEFEENNDLNKFGFLKIDKDLKLAFFSSILNSILTKDCKEIYSNNYQKRIILKKKDLETLIKVIFNKRFCEFITSKTGLKYTIDFFGAYHNFPIPYEKQNQPWYANHYHLDKPNGKNMLKIFLPISDIGIENGPLELLDINNTKNYFSSNKSIDFYEKKYFIGGLGDAFFCKLNLCLHKAGIPSKNKKTKLIMMQLNPSNNWCFHSEIYERQYKKEPKFTSLLNLLGQQKLIKL